MDTESDRNLDRFERKAIIEAEKRKKPGECLKYVQAIIAEEFPNEPMGSKILAASTINCVLKELPVPRTIYWRRSVQQLFTATNNEVHLNDKYHDENILLHFMPATDLNSLITNNGLSIRIQYIKSRFPDKQLTLLIFGLKEFCRINKTKVSRYAFETALTELQMFEGVSHRLLDTFEDIAQVFLQFSKSIAEKPYKKDRDGKMSEQNFYLANDNKDCVQVKDNIGLLNLWKNTLCKFPQVTLDTAEAIIREYPTNASLIKAYRSNDINGPLLLAEIPIRRSGGPLTSSRKIGAELSRKIHSFYTNPNPDFVL